MEIRRLDRELEELKMKVLQMAALTEQALNASIKAFFQRDSDLAEKVIEGDQEINLQEVDIDNFCLRLLALEQPMAGDLRFIVGCMRVCVNLERLADQAVNIAERTLFLNQRPGLPHQPLLEQLVSVAKEMYSLVLSSFVNRDAELAAEICDMDDKADSLNVRILRHYIDYMVTEVRSVERAVNAIIISRCLERVADLTTNIAEAIVFIVKGVDIKHQCQQ